MKSTLTRQLVLSALSLSLTACATPIATTPAPAPVQVADTAQAPVPAAPAAMEAAPAAPAAAPTAAQATVHVAGVASFGADALSGYALKAYDAVTNAEVALSGTPMTDAKGAFDVTVAGVAAGRYVRLVATKAGVAVEATFAAGPQDKLALDATSTFLSQLAAGPLEVSGWATAGAADKAAAEYFGKVQALSTSAAAMLAQQNAMAGAIVRVPSSAKELSDQDAAYVSGLSNLGQVQALMTASAEVVKAAAGAESAPAPAQRSVLGLPTGHSVKFRGTQLSATKGEGGQKVHLTNTVSGKTVEGKDATNVQAVSKVKRTSHSHRGVRQLSTFPASAIAELEGDHLPIFEVVDGPVPPGYAVFSLPSDFIEGTVKMLKTALCEAQMVSGTPPTVTRSDAETRMGGTQINIDTATGALSGPFTVGTTPVPVAPAYTAADSYMVLDTGMYVLVFYFQGGKLFGYTAGYVIDGEFQTQGGFRRRTAAVEPGIILNLD